MRKLIGFMKGHVPAILLIIVVLVVQAYCDLALPSYTSNIVDVGIQQGGIEDGVPNVLRESTMNTLLMLTTESEDETVLASYEKVEKGDSSYEKEYPLVKEEALYVLKEADKESQEKRKELMDIMGLPMMMVSGMASGQTGTDGEGAQSFSMMGGEDGPASMFIAGKTQEADGDNSLEEKSPSASGTEASKEIASSMQEDPQPDSNAQMAGMMQGIPDETVLEIRSQVTEKLGNFSDTLVEQAAVTVVKAEYEAIGVNMDDVQMSYLWHMAFYMILLSVLGLLCAIVVGFFASRIGASVGRDLRKRLFGNVLSFSNTEMDQFSTASLITRCTNDVQQVQMVSTMLLRMMLYAPILGIGGIIKVATTDTGLEWIIFAAVAAVLGIIGGLMMVTMPKFKMMQSLVDRLNLVSREILTGLPVIRAFSREKHEEERFEQANRDLMKTQLFTNRVMSMMMPAMMLIMNIVTVGIVWFGGKGIEDGKLQVGDMMAFMVYTMLIVMSFLMITVMSILVPRAGVAAERISEVINTKSSIMDSSNTKALDTKSSANKENSGKGSEVVFDNVAFHYGNAMEDVVSNISFTAKPGQTTAIIGSTGCGKSTLLHLLLRFYDVTGGKIMIDGEDIRNMSLEKLRDQIGFVPQKGVLFSGTIESNIKYADADTSSDLMRESAEIAQAMEFINQKTEGFESPIAQGGSNVSGGQKQRLSIARAIAKSPAIYLFDDSFSALDYKTDVALRKALHEKTGDSTVIIVAQRISTILHAEQIIVLDDGQIAGIGTHEQLLETCETYQEIASSQLSEKDLKKAGSGRITDQQVQDCTTGGPTTDVVGGDDRKGE